MPRGNHWLIALLLFQMAQTLAVRWIPSLGGDAAATSVPWALFLYGLPMGLVALLLARKRWALMGSAMYATVGLALDIATFVFGVTHSATVLELFFVSGLSALMNFGVIVLSGQGFLYDHTQAASPSTRASGLTSA